MLTAGAHGAAAGVDDRPDPFAELLPNCYPAEFLPVDNFG
jgi:hypothetical protein